MDQIVLFINGARGLSVARAISEAGHSISEIIVPTMKSGANEFAKLCTELSAKFTEETNVNDKDFISRLKIQRPRLSIIAGFSTIFRGPLLAVPELGTLNLHAGKLPQYRGGSPLNWQIINGENKAGLSIIRADTGIDTGDVVAETDIPIKIDDTIFELHAKANSIFPKLAVEVLRQFETGNLSGRVQDERSAIYWHQRNDDDGRIDWHNTKAVDVYNLVRAISRPYPGAFCHLGDRKLRIYRTRHTDQTIQGVPGRVVWLQGTGPYVICADHAVLLEEYDIDGDATLRLRHGSHLH